MSSLLVSLWIHAISTWKLGGRPFLIIRTQAQSVATRRSSLNRVERGREMTSLPCLCLSQCTFVLIIILHNMCMVERGASRIAKSTPSTGCTNAHPNVRVHFPCYRRACGIRLVYPGGCLLLQGTTNTPIRLSPLLHPKRGPLVRASPYSLSN